MRASEIPFVKAVGDVATEVVDKVVDTVLPSSTGSHNVDKILDKLKVVASSTGIPLGFLIGWIIKESGGRLDEKTSLDERGYFQLMPSESKSLGLDHERLSTDSDYSIAGGVKLIQMYMKRADALGIAPHGTSYYWKLVKLLHTMGSGSVDAIVAAAKAAGATGSWEDLEQYATDNNATLLSATKHSPSKWFPLVDKVYSAGKAFGFGSDSPPGTAVAGASYARVM